MGPPHSSCATDQSQPAHSPCPLVRLFLLPPPPRPTHVQGYCYINYSTPDAAAAAIEQLNGIEFPPASGHRIKVMHAEPLGVRNNSVGLGAAHSPLPMASPSPVHTPLSHGMAAELASVQDSLANMSMPRVASNNGVEELHMASPVNGPHAGVGSLHAAKARACARVCVCACVWPGLAWLWHVASTGDAGKVSDTRAWVPGRVGCAVPHSVQPAAPASMPLLLKGSSRHRTASHCACDGD